MSMNLILNQLNNVDILIHEEVKYQEAILLLEELEKEGISVEEDKLRHMILKSSALIQISEKNEEIALALANESFKQSKQSPEAILFIDALVTKLEILFITLEVLQESTATKRWQEKFSEYLLHLDNVEKTIESSKSLTSQDQLRRQANVNFCQNQLFLIFQDT